MNNRKRLLPLLILAALLLFHIVNNWIWLSTNLVIVGWDRPRHLIESLRYNDLLKNLSYPSFFEAFTLSGYYPPLFHLLIVAFYKLFGLSADVAAMVNSLFLAILLSSTYLIGRKLWGRGEGLLAAFLLSTFPMIFALSRYTYIEFALTAMVALSISLLLLCDGFTQRGASLAFGLSMGLGLLTKWTYALFVLPPLILIVARLPLRSWLIKPSLDRKWASLSALLGLALALLWYLPVREQVAQLPLGHGLLPLSWLLLFSLIYILSRKGSQGVNFLSTLWLGGTVAATWYLSRIDFIQHTFLIAWGRPQRREWGFSYYLDHLVNEQLSPLYAGLVVLVILGLLVAWLKRRALLQGLRQGVRSERVLFLLWLLLPYLVLSFRASSIHSRFLMPILPALALLLSRGLLRAPGVRLRWGILALVTLVALGQFFALSYDGLGWLRSAAVIDMPGYGPLNLFAHGYQNQLPRSEQTDAGYWIAPDILEYIKEDSGEKGAELGLLVNCQQIHEEHFLYLIYTDYPEIRLRELARNWTGRPAYPQLFEVDYFALSTDYPANRFSEESRQSIEMILKDPPPLFEAAFEMVKGYPLPDGNTIYLYKRLYPRPEGHPPTDYEALGETLTTYSQPGDGLLIPTEEVNLLGPYYLGQATPYLLGEEWDESRLREALTHHRRLFALFDGGEGAVEEWLNEQGYRAWEEWYGEARLVLYATPLGIKEPEFKSVDVEFGEELSLLGDSLIDQEVEPGEVVRLALYWEAKKGIEREYKVFIHLIDENGQLVAQRDSQPQGGSKPTSGWEAGEEIEDHYGVWLSEGVLPGEYELVMGLYEPSSGQRLPIFDGEGRRLPEDRIPLGKVRVR